MSLVRMCDKCGEVFSEKLEGWQTFTVTKTSTNAYGQRVAIPEDFDACPSCSFTGTVQPVIRDDAPKEIRGEIMDNPTKDRDGFLRIAPQTD